MGAEVHEIALLVDLELVVGPKGIVEGIVAVLAVLGVLGVVEAGHVAHHVHAQLAVEVGLTLVEGPHPHSHLYTPILRKYVSLTPSLHL